MIDLNKYADFVMAVTSKESREVETFVARLKAIHFSNPNLNGSLLLTAMIGLTSEAGEAQEIVKKVLFQGKPFTEETRRVDFASARRLLSG